MKNFEQKLHAYNSYLEINNEDIIDLNLEYCLDNYSVVYYKEGKRNNEETKPCILFTITGKTKDNKKAYFEFELRLGLDDLNKYLRKPIDISKYVSFDGPCCQVGDEEPLFFLFQTSNKKIDDMYRKIASAYVYKKSKNVFIFKLFIPEEKLFTYFEVDFNERKEDKC